VRIVFLCTSGLDNASPRGRWLPLACELARLGHEPHLVLLHPTFDVMPVGERDFVQDGVHIMHVAQMHVYGLPGARRYFGTGELVRVSRHAAETLAHHALALRPDVLHICKPQPINGLAGWWAARRLDRPFFVDCDDFEAEANRTTNLAQRTLIRWCEDTLPRHASGITVNTHFLLNRYQALGVDVHRIVHVPNGADPAPVDIRALPTTIRNLVGQPVVLYVGTLSTLAHGVDLLIDAFAHVRRRVSGATLVMVGDGDDRGMLHAHASQLGLGEAVHWVGRVAPDDAQHYFGVARCSVDPVRDIPGARGRSPLKIVESLAAGVPVVTSDVGDRRAMLGDGGAGVLVRPGDAAALADGLVRVLTDDGLHQTLAAGALAERERYGWRALSRRWLGIYDVT